MATTIKSMAFHKCNSLTSVSLPVATTLEYNTFSHCSALTSIKLPMVTTILNYALTSCDVLTSVSLPKVAPAIGESSLGTVRSGISIYVYSEEEEAEGYTAENGWDVFKEIIYVGATGIRPNDATDIKAFVDESGRLHIQGINNASEVTLYNTMGSLVAKSIASNLDVQLRSGIYFVKVGSKTIKVVSK